MRRHYFLGIALLLTGAAHGEEFAACPATIRVERQKLAAPVAGWSVVSKEPQPHRLQFVTFYDGAPAEEASLAPDRSTRLQQTWEFLGLERPYWLTCHYAGTSVILGRALPKQIKTCTVTFAANVTIDGSPAIQRLTCQ
jgi:hypothetical protein